MAQTDRAWMGNMSSGSMLVCVQVYRRVCVNVDKVGQIVWKQVLDVSGPGQVRADNGKGDQRWPGLDGSG